MSEKKRLIPRSLNHHDITPINHDITSLNLSMPSPLPSYSSPNDSLLRTTNKVNKLTSNNDDSLLQTSKLDKMLNLSFTNNEQESSDISSNISGSNHISNVSSQSQSDILPIHISSISSIPKEDKHEHEHSNSNSSQVLRKLPSLFTLEPPMRKSLPSSMSELLREWGVPSPVKKNNQSQNANNMNNNQNSINNNQNMNERQTSSSYPNNDHKWNNEVFSTENFIHNEISRVRQETSRAMDLIRKKLLFYQTKRLQQPINNELKNVYTQIFNLLNDATQCFHNISKLVDELNLRFYPNNTNQNNINNYSNHLPYQMSFGQNYQQPQHYTTTSPSPSIPMYQPSRIQILQQQLQQEQQIQQQQMQQQQHPQNMLFHQQPDHSNINYSPKQPLSQNYNTLHRENNTMQPPPPPQQQQQQQQHYSDQTLTDLQFLRDLENRVKEAWSVQTCSPRTSQYINDDDDDYDVTAVHDDDADDADNDMRKSNASSIEYSSSYIPGDKTLNNDDLSVEQLLKRSEANFRKLEKNLAKSRNRDLSVSKYTPLRASKIKKNKKRMKQRDLRRSNDSANDVLKRWL